MAELPEEFKKNEGKADAEVEKEAEAKKADADAGEKLDKLLTALDSISRRMDAMEEEDKARKDAAEKCAADAAKSDEGKDPLEDTKPAEVAADKKKDAEDEEAKAKADAEEKERMDRAKADADIAKRIADVEAKMPRQMSDEEYASMADAQARADSVYSGFGKRAPRPLDGETLALYRRRLASNLKEFSKDWKAVDVRLLDTASFDVVESKIYADAAISAAHPSDLAEGEIRAIRTTDPDTGHRITKFAGNASFVRQFKQPARIITDMPLSKQSRAG